MKIAWKTGLFPPFPRDREKERQTEIKKEKDWQNRDRAALWEVEYIQYYCAQPEFFPYSISVHSIHRVKSCDSHFLNVAENKHASWTEMNWAPALVNSGWLTVCFSHRGQDKCCPLWPKQRMSTVSKECWLGTILSAGLKENHVQQETELHGVQFPANRRGKNQCVFI